MNKLLKYLPFHFLIALVFGICIQFFMNTWSFGFQKLGLLLALIVLILWGIYYLKKPFVFTISSWILFVFIGISSVYVNDARNYNNYFNRFLTNNSVAIIEINKVLKTGNYHYKYEAEVIQIDNNKTQGKVLLNIKKDSIKKLLKVNEQLFLKSSFKELNNSLNPHQFNYKEYLARQGIYHQIFISNKQFKIVDRHNFSLIGLSAKFRNNIQQSLKKYHFSNNEFAVINALLLGQRQEISRDLIQDYSRAGAIHILAVSGLHVGIILLILLFIFKPLEKLKTGIYFKTFLIVILFWMFAFIAGLSASVVRAVTMFTFVALGQLVKRKNNVEHALVTSMFVLLLIKPMFLFDVGFQLSYLAVFGIVWVQPLLYNLWKPKLYLFDYSWRLITVSIAAQTGILPISLYYFHQFPGLFILSNLIIIPFLGGILFGGIVIILLALLRILPQFLADFYGYVISLMNRFVSSISRQENFLFQDISMSFLLMLAWYIVIVFSFRFFVRRKPKEFVYFLISIIFIQGISIFEKYKQNSKNEFIVFHKSRKSIIGNRIADKLQMFSTLDSLKLQQQKIITAYKVAEKVDYKISNKSVNVFLLDKQQVLVVDSLGIYGLNGLKNPIVLLQYSPKINLKRLIAKLQPKKIIADGTNYKSYTNRWEATCKKEKTPFHYTAKNGAFVLPY